ncbi:hypothetical protein GIB67_019192 [Kingdonia uniflora]|uniref:Cucumisin n=1 Tax=Kingdonia uniflora TaxID=39325 RepID=A0A7J7MZU9_9MAGN|nr:hypothetical protein GIB67_019192 [Kingdonia uniflora]
MFFSEDSFKEKARTSVLSLLYPFLLASLVLNSHCLERKIHIVYMGEHPTGKILAASMHHSKLEGVLGSYTRSFNGFAAKLSDEEIQKFSEMEGMVSVLPNTKLKLHTTRSWDFSGLTLSRSNDTYSGDVIIGMFDTGIWPESASFSDEGFQAPPAKWKGKCMGAINFTCNNKIIGARFYNSEDNYDVTDIQSPRNTEGHGSHISSTAAGNAVGGANYFGLAEGVARGGVPGARIAMYKVCWSYGCSSADILAAFDDALADEVDILSVSLGFDEPIDYFDDPIAIGTFHAMKNGILTSNSAGNSGPYPGTVSNYSPWSLTVAASTIDRKFVSELVLGDGQSFTGTVINNFEMNGTSFPLIWGGDAVNVSAGFVDSNIVKLCVPGSLDSNKIQGKIVLCDLGTDSAGVLQANGADMIMSDTISEYLTGYNRDYAFSFPLPTTFISVRGHCSSPK